jgi:nitrate reductase delta subunit
MSPPLVRPRSHDGAVVAESGHDRRTRLPLSASQADLLIVASLLLAYPDDDVCARRGDLAAAVAQLIEPSGTVPSSAKRALRRFLTWWEQADPTILRQDYVATFDTRRGSALYVTYRTHGDQRTRGQVLHNMAQIYRRAGFEPTSDELPDHLPTLCQFAGLADPALLAEALDLADPGISGIHDCLTAQHSPWADVVAAIIAVLWKGDRP